MFFQRFGMAIGSMTVLVLAAACSARDAPSPDRIGPVYAPSEVDRAPRLGGCSHFDPSVTTYTVTLSYVVGVDGRAEPSSIRILDVDGPRAFDETSPNTGAAQEAKQVVATCVWEPARVGGKPVRTRVGQSISF